MSSDFYGAYKRFMKDAHKGAILLGPFFFKERRCPNQGTPFRRSRIGAVFSILKKEGKENIRQTDEKNFSVEKNYILNFKKKA